MPIYYTSVIKISYSRKYIKGNVKTSPLFNSPRRMGRYKMDVYCPMKIEKIESHS